MDYRAGSGNSNVERDFEGNAFVMLVCIIVSRVGCDGYRGYRGGDADFVGVVVAKSVVVQVYADITGSSGATYTLIAAGAGKAIKVRVSFTDDQGHAESLTSAAKAAVTMPPLTASAHDVPESHDGSAAFTFELRFSETPKDGFSYRTLRDHVFTVTGGTVTKARRLETGKNVRWEITVQPSGNADVTVALPVTTDCSGQGAICAGDGRKLSSALEITVSGPDG